MKRSISIDLWQYGSGLLSDKDIKVLQDVLDLLSDVVTANCVYLKGDLYDTRMYTEWKDKEWDLRCVRTIITTNTELITREIAQEVFRRIDEIEGIKFIVTNYQDPKKGQSPAGPH